MISDVEKYIKRGWVIHPLSKPDDDKQSPGKRPLLNEWQKLTKTPEDLEKYLKKGCNIGLVCGKASGLTIIDFDYEFFLSDITANVEFKTLGSRRTGGRGHLYFKYTDKIPSQKHHLLGIEILSDGSNAVLPPSIHHSGEQYKWVNDCEPCDFSDKLIDNLNKLFNTEKELINKISQCRPCFKNYWNDDIKVSHGSTTRLFLGAFCSELFNKGATLEHIKLFAKIIYKSDYDERKTVREFNGWTQKNFPPWTCEKLKEQCNGFVNCDSCSIKKVAPDNACVEMELNEIMTLHQSETERRIMMDLPDSHFISEYIKWMSSLSDGYRDYQILCALWILSALTRNRVCLRLKQDTIKPNLWIFIIGKSTTSRKSTIVNKTRRIYEMATDTVLYNEDYSIEGYLETLSHFPIINNVRDEAAGLMAKFHKKYNEGILELECAIYDGQSFKKTLASGKGKEPRIFEVNSPFVTKLYATTPDNFTRYMSIDDFTGGYGFRLLYCHPNFKKERKGLEMENEEDIVMWGRILSRVKILNKFFSELTEEMEFKITPDAMDYYNQTVYELENRAEELNNDLLNSAIGRSQAHILKIAMLLELGKNNISKIINIDSMRSSCELVINYFIPALMDIIDRLQEDIKYNQIEKTIGVLRKLGGVASHSKVLHDTKIIGRDFYECIETMIESKTVSKIRDKNSKVVYYRLLNHSKIPSILPIPPVPLYTQSIDTRENLENSNNIKKLDSIYARVITPTPSVSDISRELGEFRELGESEGKLKKENQGEIVKLLKLKYEKLSKPDSKDDLLRLKNVMVSSILLEFDTEEPSRYVDDYCHVRQWE